MQFLDPQIREFSTWISVHYCLEAELYRPKILRALEISPGGVLIVLLTLAQYGEGGKGRFKNTSLALKRALAHGLQNPKWLPGGPKMAKNVWKRSQRRRKKREKNEKKNDEHSGHYVIASS